MWRCSPVIRAHLEVETGRLQTWAQPGQVNNLARPYLWIKNKKRGAEGIALYEGLRFNSLGQKV